MEHSIEHQSHLSQCIVARRPATSFRASERSDWGTLMGSVQNGVAFGVRIALGCIFVISAGEKLALPYDFLSSIYDYAVVGPEFGRIGAEILPWVELVVGLVLLSGAFKCGALSLSVMLLTGYTILKFSVLARGLRIPCGCFFRDRGAPVTATDVMIGGVASFVALATFVVTARSHILANVIETGSPIIGQDVPVKHFVE